MCILTLAIQLPVPAPTPKHRPIAAPAPVNRRKAPHPLLIGGILAGLYGIYLYRSYPESIEVDPSNTDVSYRYNATASTFDKEVDLTERFTGITKLRRELVEQASGKVLEAAVGTGRNSEFYDLDRIKSLTLLDQSREMVEVARAKWQETYTEEERCRFVTRSALDPLPKAPKLGGESEDEGYDTIVATMSLCSTPLPSLFLRNLATGLSYHHDPSPASTASEASSNPDSHLPKRILLLEHGQSHYWWVNKLLDRTAPAHALKHGCWWNRDIGQIARDSGLEIINTRRKNFGTTWWLELGLPDIAKGERRQQWLNDTRREIESKKVELQHKRGRAEIELREGDEARRQEKDLERWRQEQREQMKTRKE
ncbi:MAG: hypothetical protein Q9219_006732 [cf. Caloplaca sp. 3 TL-2023]